MQGQRKRQNLFTLFLRLDCRRIRILHCIISTFIAFGKWNIYMHSLHNVPSLHAMCQWIVKDKWPLSVQKSRTFIIYNSNLLYLLSKNICCTICSIYYPLFSKDQPSSGVLSYKRKRHTLTQVYSILKYRVQPWIKCGSNFVMNSFIYIQTYIYTHTNIHADTNVGMYIYIYTHTHTHTHTHMWGLG